MRTTTTRRAFAASTILMLTVAATALAQASPAPEVSSPADPPIAAESSPLTSPPAGSPSAAGQAMPIGSDTGPLEPGTYVDDSLGLEVRFTVGEGWQLSGPPIPDVGVEISRQGPGPAALTITRFDGVVFSQPCITDGDPESYLADTATVETSPQGFVEHLSAIPFLDISEPIEVQVGGMSGLQLDLSSSIPAECDPPVTFLWALPVVAEFHLNDGENARAFALDVSGGVVVVFIEAFPEVAWEPFLEEAMSVVSSLDITPG